jgi:hypothetical protein
MQHIVFAQHSKTLLTEIVRSGAASSSMLEQCHLLFTAAVLAVRYSNGHDYTRH